ncbi:MAG: PAS domain-containing protein [Gammaproteobacteria bacterium]|nr:PAS domain-containing protein [Gammaproteobacteria bacterium]
MTAGNLQRSHTPVIDALATAVVVLDSSLTVAQVNPAAEDLLGISTRRAVGRDWSTLLGPQSELLALTEKVSDTQSPLSRSELRLQTADGKLLVVDCRISRIEDDRFLIELHDASARLHFNREVALLTQQQVGRDIGRQLAHEIRNPLAGLRGAAQLLQRAVDDGLATHTQIIIDEADRLSALVGNMLGPQQPSRRDALNVHEPLQHVTGLLRGEAPSGIAIVEDYDPSLPRLSLDRDQVIQVLLNLGRNALQAMGESGQLTLRTRAENGLVLRGIRHRLVARIDFEDTGSGVPEALRESLFYPLVTSRSDGTGLGLALAQELVGRHDGLIRLQQAAAPTIFSVYLPGNGND